jgi:hypothetical protein
MMHEMKRYNKGIMHQLAIKVMNTKDLKTLGFVEIGDDTTHPITQIGKVPLSMQDGQTNYLKNVLHVPTITKKIGFRGLWWNKVYM